MSAPICEVCGEAYIGGDFIAWMHPVCMGPVPRVSREVKKRTLDDVIAWLESEEAMAAYDGLSECTYTNAVLPDRLAMALRDGALDRWVEQHRSKADG